ncbi:MAG: hypothetical protein L6V93_06775 [Clostridiales bacterium]|nr:MAG: hypothetical protein L6V93_06775 [Clostridiales bacterium]
MADLNSTPSAKQNSNRFFSESGTAEKSSLINALANQEISIVSDVLGHDNRPCA